jgi:ADP-glucose pyrophosphorylase
LAAEGKTSLVGSGCDLADGVELEETVLGDGVMVTRPIRLERCVVMPDVVIDDGGTITDTIITRTARLHAGG